MLRSLSERRGFRNKERKRRKVTGTDYGRFVLLKVSNKYLTSRARRKSRNWKEEKNRREIRV